MYCNEIIDSSGYVHSIDMIYVEYYIYAISDIFNICRLFRDKFNNVSYDEYLDKKYSSKYNFYKDSFSIGGCYISVGKYHNYDKVSKTHTLLPMMEIRFNPNKLYNLEWFKFLFSELLKCTSSGSIRKFDYAVDVPVSIDSVQVFDSKKIKGLYRGTKYYGVAGRHGYLKIYDKRKEREEEENINTDLTRIEHTLFYGKDYSLENVYIYVPDSQDYDFKKAGLNDTDVSIIDMFLRLKALNIDYELNLGRKKKEKLLPFLFGQFELLNYSNYLDLLLEKWVKLLNVSGIHEDENGFLYCDDSDLPFD